MQFKEFEGKTYPGEMLPTARTIKEMLPIRYGKKKPQS
jgi:hypothetical protein